MGYMSPDQLRKNYKWMLFLGLCCTGTQVLHRVSLLTLSASFVQTIKGCQPFFTSIVAVIWLGERFSIRTYAAVGLVVAGVVLSCISEADWNLFGVLAVLGSTFFIAFSSVGTKYILKANPNLDDHSIWILVSQGIFSLNRPLLSQS